MTLLAPLWLQNLAGGFNASADRQIIEALLTPGVLAAGDLKVTPRATGTPLSVDVAAGRCVIEGTDTTGQGVYLAGSDTAVNIALAAQPPTGQSRVDLIVAQVRDSSVTGTDDDWLLAAVTGTPTSGTPVVPPTPASSLVLAQIKVDGPTVLTSWITDKRTISTTPLAGYGITLPPGRDGQITAALGRLWVSLAGTWREIGVPTRAAQTVTGGPWPIGIDGDSTLQQVAVAPPGDISTTAVAQATVNMQVHGGSDAAFGWARCDISANNGISWNLGQPQNVYSANIFDARSVTVQHQMSVSGPDTVQARLLVRRTSGTTRWFQASTSLLLHPR